MRSGATSAMRCSIRATARASFGKSPVAVEPHDRRIRRDHRSSIDTAGRAHPPPGTRAHGRHWLHFAEGTAMPPVISWSSSRIERADPFSPGPSHGGITEGEGRLHRSQPAAVVATSKASSSAETGSRRRVHGGRYQMASPSRRPRRVGTRPAMARFLERIHARPAYQRAIEKGGKVSILA